MTILGYSTLVIKFKIFIDYYKDFSISGMLTPDLEILHNFLEIQFFLSKQNWLATNDTKVNEIPSQQIKIDFRSDVTWPDVYSNYIFSSNTMALMIY